MSKRPQHGQLADAVGPRRETKNPDLATTKAYLLLVLYRLYPNLANLARRLTQTQTNKRISQRSVAKEWRKEAQRTEAHFTADEENVLRRSILSCDTHLLKVS